MTYLQKCKSSAILRYLKHFARESVDMELNTVTKRNSSDGTVSTHILSINPNRTKENYTLKYMSDGSLKRCRADEKTATKCGSQFKKRICELPHRHTKATIGMCVWSVSCPAEFSDNSKEMRQFFEVIFKFTAEHYGRNNVFAGFVLLDEDIPRILIPFVPAYKKIDNDENEKELKCEYCLNAKALISRYELRLYQQSLDKICTAIFGMPRQILINGGYKAKKQKLSLAEYKRLIKKKQDDNNKELLLRNITLKYMDDLTKARLMKEIAYRRMPTEDDIPESIPAFLRTDWLIKRKRWFVITGSWEKAPPKFYNMAPNENVQNSRSFQLSL